VSGTAGAHGALARAVMLGDPPDDAVQAAALSVARENGLGLELATHLADGPARRGEELRERQFLGAQAEASSLLGGSGVEHILFKVDRLYRYYDSNVDVIVRVRDWPEATALLERQGYVGSVMFKEPDKVMFSRPDDAVSLHLHPGVTWNGVPYFDDDALWSQSEPDPTVARRRRLRFEDELAVNLAHDLFENYEVSLGDALYFRRAFERDVALAELEPLAKGNGWVHGLRAAFGYVRAIADGWAGAEKNEIVPPGLLEFPYRIPRAILARAFGERITAGVRDGRIRRAARELYAYPAFYALARRHDLIGGRA
jgi:hypothetical protein